MSTLKHPAGRQSSKVYRRRRLVVALGLLAVLVIVFLIIVKPGSSRGADDKPATAADATPRTTRATQAPPTPAAEPSLAATPTPTPTPGAPCSVGVVKVEALTDAQHYAPDETPKLSLRVTNTGTVACTLNAGTSKQVFTISSGTDVYWTSTDCQKGAKDTVVTLEPGVAVASASPITWDRTRSAAGTCASDKRPTAPANGSAYKLSVTVNGITSVTPRQFQLD